jgi:hypothetical protein
VAYIMAGASWDERELSLQDHCIQAFLNVGLHGALADGTDSADVQIVSELHGGQFDLNFCSTSCMRAWFNAIVDRVEQQVPHPKRP